MRSKLKILIFNFILFCWVFSDNDNTQKRTTAATNAFVQFRESSINPRQEGERTSVLLEANRGNKDKTEETPFNQPSSFLTNTQHFSYRQDSVCDTEKSRSEGFGRPRLAASTQRRKKKSQVFLSSVEPKQFVLTRVGRPKKRLAKFVVSFLSGRSGSLFGSPFYVLEETNTSTTSATTTTSSESESSTTESSSVDNTTSSESESSTTTTTSSDSESSTTESSSVDNTTSSESESSTTESGSTASQSSGSSETSSSSASTSTSTSTEESPYKSAWFITLVVLLCLMVIGSLVGMVIMVMNNKPATEV